MSIPVPTEVVNSTDAQVQQLYALANEEGDELSGTYDWQVMRKQHLFNTVASAVQASAVPSDLDHFIANSFFNRTTMRYIYGPITPQEWQAIQAQPQLNRVFLAFIERGDYDQIREALREAKDDTGLYAGEIADMVERLGLCSRDMVVQEYDVTITVPVTVTVRVEAYDDESAEYAGKEELECNGIDNYYMDIDWYNMETYEVNEA